MDEKVERVIETSYKDDGTVIFRRDDGSTIAKFFVKGRIPTKMVKYHYSTTPNPPPSSGQVRTDNDQITSVSTIWIHCLDSSNQDDKNLFMSLKAGQQLYVQDIDNSDSYALFTLTNDPEDSGDYITCYVECSQFNETPLAGNVIFVGGIR